MKYTLIPVLLLLALVSCNKKQKRNNINNDIAKDYFIAYNIHEKDTTDNYEIIIMNMDGSDKKNITNDPDVAWAFYAYQDKLYFISDKDTCYRCYFLYETDVNGENVRKVTELQLEDSWMNSRKNGSELVVTGRIGRDIRFQLFTIDVKSGNYTQITNDTAARYGDPVFSPDGKQIVYSYKKNKRDRSTHEELFIMNEDGTGIKQLTTYPENNPSAKNYGYRAGASRWHPTENFISYVSMQDGRHSIYAVTPDGKKQWKLIENEASEGWHDWSSDGKWLVFNNSDREETQFHITLMNWKTKEQKQLTDTTYTAQQAPVFIEKIKK